MLNVSEKLPDKSLYRRLNSIASAKDAVANKVLYHNLCWAAIKQKGVNKSEKIEDYWTILAYIEIIWFIESKFKKNKNNALGMSKLNELYKNVLNKNGKKYEDISKNYKKHLKNLIYINIEGVLFLRPKQKDKAEQLSSSSKSSEIISDMIDESATEFVLNMMGGVAKIIRKDILKKVEI